MIMGLWVCGMGEGDCVMDVMTSESLLDFK